MAKKTIDEKIDDLALAMASGFTAVDKRFEEMDKKIATLATKDYIDKKIANLPDKAYLDDKLSNLKGDITVLIRKEDTKLKASINVLAERKVITAKDKQRIFSLEPFPQSI